MHITVLSYGYDPSITCVCFCTSLFWSLTASYQRRSISLTDYFASAVTSVGVKQKSCKQMSAGTEVTYVRGSGETLSICQSSSSCAGLNCTRKCIPSTFCDERNCHIDSDTDTSSKLCQDSITYGGRANKRASVSAWSASQRSLLVALLLR